MRKMVDSYQNRGIICTSSTKRAENSVYIHRKLPDKKFTRCPNKVAMDTSISDGAFRLYMFLLTIHPSANYTDSYLMQLMGLSRRSITNRRAELKKKDLLIVEQVAPRVYASYVGYPDFPASKVMAEVKKEDFILSGEEKDDNG